MGTKGIESVFMVIEDGDSKIIQNFEILDVSVERTERPLG